MTTQQPGPGHPTPPIPIAGGADVASIHIDAHQVAVSDGLLTALEGTGSAVTTDLVERTEAGRDWWPLAMTWATDGETPARAGAVVRPSNVDQLASVLALANEATMPTTVSGGRSGVCGGSVPVHGGLVCDMTAFGDIRQVDDESLLVRVGAGMFGDHFETQLQAAHGLTIGHWPQSMSLSTIGGWVACRGAGQYSTRYGKIEDLVVGLEVVLADGTVLHTGGQPRAAVGPDLTQLFVGSEGTLGVVSEVTLRARPRPDHTRQGAWGFPTFSAGLDACRRILRRGATPAVLRLYDSVESMRNFGLDTNLLLVFDEGDERLIDAGFVVVEESCGPADRLDDGLVDQWMEHRNNVDALEPLISGGLVVDTMEIAAPWARLHVIYEQVLAAIRAVPGTLVASAHQSHAYQDGACLYFTFAGKPEQDGPPEGPSAKDGYYRRVWDAGTRTVLANSGALSHHHGIGLNRSRFMTEALGAGFEALVALKGALDPRGILNPGKLGLPSPFGPVTY